MYEYICVQQNVRDYVGPYIILWIQRILNKEMNSTETDKSDNFGT